MSACSWPARGDFGLMLVGEALHQTSEIANLPTYGVVLISTVIIPVELATARSGFPSRVPS